MDRKFIEIEKPSIIQEIVFYDKPNVKTVVPETILPQANKKSLGKGDIIISRIRKSSLSHTSPEKQVSIPDKQSKSPKKQSKIVLKKDSQLKNKALSTIDSLNHFINYEDLEDDSEYLDIAEESSDLPESSPRKIKNKKDGVKASQKSKTLSNTTDHPDKDNVVEQDKVDKSTEKPCKPQKEKPKNVKKTNDNSKEENTKISSILKKNSINTNEDPKKSPFKTPKRPAKKVEQKSQKLTILNYITKKTTTDSKGEKGSSAKELSVAKNKTTITPPKGRVSKRTQNAVEKVVSPQNKVVSSGKEKLEKNEKKATSTPKITDLKRTRGRSKKSVGDEPNIVKTEAHYSDDDVSFKTPKKDKNYAELTNVPLDSDNVDGLEELLNEAQQQSRTLDRVEEELQNMFQDGHDKRPQAAKLKRITPSGKISKTPGEPNKRVKKEDGDGNESNIDPFDVSTECDDDDGDSRSEWIPLEYAEYKQQRMMKNQKKSFQCKFCGEQYSTYYGMRKHRALTHDDVGKDRKEEHYEDSVTCKQEKELAESDDESVDEWMPQDYADYKMKHKMNKMKRVQWYKCKICCAVFSNYYKLSKHKMEHAKIPNPYECKHCDDRFNDVESLMAHIRVHQGKDPYQCRKCDRGFLTKEEYEEHIPVHILKKGPTPPKRYRCDVCSKEFSKLCDIERHTRVHTGEKPSECNICHKRFQQSHNLSKHLLTHLHVKPFQCEICNKKFGRIDVLNRHLLTHSMEKPFKCVLCARSFIRQVQLTNHVQKAHDGAKKGPSGTGGQKNAAPKAEANVTEDDSAEEDAEDTPNEDSVEIGEHYEEVVGV